MPGTYYRLANRRHLAGEATEADSWLRPYETKGASLFGQTGNPEAHGLSVFASLEDLTNVRELVPFMRRKAVAEVEVAKDHGHLRCTPEQSLTYMESHHDWWTSPFDRQPAATVIEAGEGVQ